MKKGDAQSKASPPVKVVGFRVEGATPSPRDTSLADAAGVASTVTGSPSPVIIPPAFTGQSRGGDATPTMRSAGGAVATPGSVSSAPYHDDASEASSLPPIRTEPAAGLDPDSFAKDRTPTKAVASPPGRALPLTPVGTSAPADLGGQFAAAASADSPRLLQPTISDAAVAAPAAAVPASAPPAAAVAAPKPSPAKPQQAAQQQPAAAQQQAAKPAAEPAVGPPGEAKKSMKEMSKAERRALQEAQRAAKAAAKAAAQPAAAGGGSGGKPLQKQGSGGNLARQGRQTSDVKEAAKAAAGGEGVAKAGKGAAGAAKGGAAAQKSAADATVPPAKLMAMFAHLPLPRGITLESIAQQKGPPVPLIAAKLGLQYADGSLRGGNARCIAMLQMFVQCIQDFRTPAGREFAKEFSPALNNIINFLVACRPLSVSMGNAIKSIKSCLEKMKLQPPPSEQQAKDMLIEKIQDYLEQKIRFADRMLVKHAIEKIQDGDTIMTYAYSSVVAATLLAAHKAGKRFDVVVVDSRPLFEGRRMLTTLLAGGITCEYCHLNGLSYEITEVDKVFLGAASVLSNGAVLSRVGTAAVALMAAAQRVPVLVCCESYKFHERVQLDSITHNELLDQRLLATVPDRQDVPAMTGWQSAGAAASAPATPDDKMKRVHLLNLAYDITPADVVTVVISEMGAVPPTSVAVILRESVRDAAVL
ncbi:hypothetical protein ABPG77_001373 [Micractinium sp. CCAP 211/92]